MLLKGEIQEQDPRMLTSNRQGCKGCGDPLQAHKRKDSKPEMGDTCHFCYFMLSNAILEENAAQKL